MRPFSVAPLAAVLLLAFFACSEDAGRLTAPASPGPLAPADHESGHSSVQSRKVNTSVAYGTVAFEGICRDGLEVVRAGTTLSAELVDRIGAGEHPAAFMPGPGFAALLAPFGPLTNLAFLTQDAGAGYLELGDAADQIVAHAHDLAATLSTGTGVPFVAEVVVTATENQVYSLFGAVILPDGTIVHPDDPDFDALAVEWGGHPATTTIVGNADIQLYLVSAVIRRADGEPAVCARQHKVSARDLLAPHANHPEKKVRKRIGKALDRLEKSLDPSLWIDDAHLDPKKGKKVFDEERKAARELMKLLDKALDEDDDSSDDDSSDDGGSGLDPSTAADLEAVVTGMLEADRAIASILMAEVDCDLEKKCEKELSKAAERFDRAERYAAEGRADKAIDEFRKAWEKAVKAASRL